MPRRPRGAYVRPTTDWFYRRISFATINTETQVGGSQGLYNDATDGSHLFLHGLVLLCPTINTYSTCSLTAQDRLLTGVYTQPQPLVGGAPTGFGQLAQLTAGINRTDIINSVTLPTTIAGFKLFPPGPIVVIPPGYTYEIIPNANTTLCWISAWWASLPPPVN